VELVLHDKDGAGTVSCGFVEELGVWYVFCQRLWGHKGFVLVFWAGGERANCKGLRGWSWYCMTTMVHVRISPHLEGALLAAHAIWAAHATLV
jgi:hypothetical protein